MFCSKCGKEISEGSIFCKHCGDKVFYEEVVKEQPVEQPEIEEPVIEEPVKEKLVEENHSSDVVNKDKSKRIKLFIGGGLLAVLVVALTIFLLTQWQKNVSKHVGVSGNNVDNYLNFHLYDVKADTIDIYAENRQPSTRDHSLTWDKTLFYKLEDIGEDEEDGKIQYYRLSQNELVNIKNENLIEYEIYTNPETGKMNKIVSIEYMGNYLEITDYYYLDNGQPNFIYQRTDSIYTPTYATPNKTGSRYYFNNDTMVQWRWIDTPNQIEEILLNISEESSGKVQHLFDSLDSNKQAEYNEQEVRMLNAAYNTYEAMQKSRDYGNIKGYIVDVDGNPVPDAKVSFLVEGKSIGHVQTDSNGYYETGISFNEEGYKIEILLKGYVQIDVYNVVVEQSKITTWIETMCLLKNTKKTHEVQLLVYDSGAVQYDENQTLIKNGLSEVSVKVRKGVNNRTGEIVGEGISDSTGSINLTLEVGIYTVETTVNGHTSNYCILKVEKDKRVEVPIVAQLTNNEMKVVLTWEGTTDLDACLFTPYKSDQGNMEYINAVNATDEHGNRFSIDGKNGNSTEVIYIADSTQGDYKYYVSDYNNCIAGNYTATDMNNLNVRVTIYDKNGLLDSYTIPHNRSGVVWEVFEMKNGKVITLQHNYSNLEGKNWWIEDKSIAEKNREARQAYYNMLCIDMPNGIMPEGYSDRGTMFQEGKEDFSFILLDINYDGIEELILKVRYGWDVFTFENSKVKTIYCYHDDSEGEVGYTDILKNGDIVSGGGDGGTWSCSLYDDVFDYLNSSYFNDLSKISYYASYANGDYNQPVEECRINDIVVLENELNDSYKINVEDQLIPETDYYRFTEENLRKVLLTN